jgi:hypothetical protein
MVCTAYGKIWNKKPNLVDISKFYEYCAMNMPERPRKGRPIKT